MLSTQAKDRLALWHACRGAPEIRVRQTGSTCTAVRARPSHICTATRLTATTSALRLARTHPAHIRMWGSGAPADVQSLRVIAISRPALALSAARLGRRAMTMSVPGRLP